MYCTNCGNEVSEKLNFCGQCGKPLRPQEANSAFFAGSAQAGAPARKLERPLDGKWLAGVCSGFARYLNVDLALVRILWLCAVLIFGTGVLAYIVCWLVMPLETRRAAGPAYSN